MPLPAALLARLAQRGLVKSAVDRDRDEHRGVREVPDIAIPVHRSVNIHNDPPEEEEEEVANCDNNKVYILYEKHGFDIPGSVFVL